MSTVRVERCPECRAVIGEGMLYQHQQKHHRKLQPCAGCAALRDELADANQQLEVLRPGGLYAWKSKYQASEAGCAALRAALTDLMTHEPVPYSDRIARLYALAQSQPDPIGYHTCGEDDGYCGGCERANRRGAYSQPDGTPEGTP